MIIRLELVDRQRVPVSADANELDVLDWRWCPVERKAVRYLGGESAGRALKQRVVIALLERFEFVVVHRESPPGVLSI